MQENNALVHCSGAQLCTLLSQSAVQVRYAHSERQGQHQ